MNQKGFTLVEILAIVPLLLLIIFIAIPNVLNMLEKAQNEAYLANERLLEKAAADYMSLNGISLPQPGQTLTISLADLQGDGIVSQINDVKNASQTCDAYVEISQDGYNQAVFESYLDCANYTTIGFAGLSNGVSSIYGDGAQDTFYSDDVDADGYITVGYTNSNNKDLSGMNKGTTDALIVKYNTTGSVVWKKTYGGIGLDYFMGIITTSDGYVATGYSASTDQDLSGLNKGGTDAIIVKYDKDGNILWQKNYGGTSTDYFRSIYLTTSGYIAIGSSYSTNNDLSGLNKGGEDGIIVKYDTSGNVVWKKNFGGTGTDALYDVVVNTDGYIYVAGQSSSNNGDLTGLNKGSTDAAIAKYDSSGTFTYAKTLGGSSTDYFRGIALATDGIIPVGYSSSTNGDMTGLNKGGADSIVAKYDFAGTLSWNKNYGGTGTDYFIAAATTGSDVIVAGYSNSTNGDLTGLSKGYYDGAMVKFDSTGAITLNKVLGGASGDDYIQGVVMNGTDFVVTGWSNSTNNDFTGLNKGNEDGFIFKYDATITNVWKYNFGGGPGADYFYGATSVPRGYVTVGYSTSITGMFSTNKGGCDGIVLKHDYEGNFLWYKNYGGTSSDYFYSVVNTTDGFVTAGYSSSTNGDLTGLNKGGNDAIMVKYDNDGNIVWKKNFGGTSTDLFYNITEVSNGFLATGYSNSTNGDLAGLNKGGSDAIIVNFDGQGNVVWKKNFGGTGTDYFKNAFQVSDGFIVVGYSNSTTDDLSGLNKGDYDSVIVKYDVYGNKLWTKTYGGTGVDYFMDVRTKDNYYYAVGYSNSTTNDLTGLNKGDYDGTIVKYDASGNIVWQKNYGGTSTDNFYAMTLQGDNLIAVGRGASTNGDLTGLNRGSYDAIMVKYDVSGTVITKQNSGGNATDYFYAVTPVRDGLVMAGLTYSNTNDFLNRGTSYLDAMIITYK